MRTWSHYRWLQGWSGWSCYLTSYNETSYLYFESVRWCFVFAFFNSNIQTITYMFVSSCGAQTFPRFLTPSCLENKHLKSSSKSMGKLPIAREFSSMPNKLRMIDLPGLHLSKRYPTDVREDLLSGENLCIHRASNINGRSFLTAMSS